MRFHRNVWYVAALSREMGREFIARTIVGIPVLFYRREDGSVTAISDTCPHRFAPLSRGKLMGDNVQCRYHGLTFGPDGRCVRNPQGDLISPNMHIRGFPIVERYEMIWIWMGAPELSDPSLIPDISAYVTGTSRRAAFSYIDARYRYDVLVDNLLDLSHADYLHEGSFSGGVFEVNDIKVIERSNEVMVTFSQFRGPPPPRDADVAPVVDRQFRAHWFPGQVIAYEGMTIPTGGNFDDGRRICFAHIATPADDNSTHYFFFRSRTFALDDPEVDAKEAASQKAVIDGEDGPMLEAVHRRMAGVELMDLKPVVLPGDAAALRVRRVMKRLMAKEEGLEEAADQAR